MDCGQPRRRAAEWHDGAAVHNRSTGLMAVGVESSSTPLGRSVHARALNARGRTTNIYLDLVLDLCLCLCLCLYLYLNLYLYL